MNMQYISLDEIQEKELIPGYHAKFVNSDTMTFAHWRIKANADMPEHSHPNEQVVNILSGEFLLRVENNEYLIKPGIVIVIPAGIPHSGTAITDCKILDVFYPKREEYK